MDDTDPALRRRPTHGPGLEWRISDTPVDYPDALGFMEQRAADIRAGTAPESSGCWNIRRCTPPAPAPPRRASRVSAFPVYQTGRGGRYTYHGPGQRVAYVMLDLKKSRRRCALLVHDLEEWVIRSSMQFTIMGERRDGRVGIWVRRGAPSNPASREDKIAAIGVRIRRWVSFHGIAINVEPDLEHFAGIVPCGINEHGITSIWDRGITATMPEVDVALQSAFADVFGNRASCNNT